MPYSPDGGCSLRIRNDIVHFGLVQVQGIQIVYVIASALAQRDPLAGILQAGGEEHGVGLVHHEQQIHGLHFVHTHMGIRGHVHLVDAVGVILHFRILSGVQLLHIVVDKGADGSIGCQRAVADGKGTGMLCIPDVSRGRGNLRDGVGAVGNVLRQTDFRIVLTGDSSLIAVFTGDLKDTACQRGDTFISVFTDIEESQSVNMYITGFHRVGIVGFCAGDAGKVNIRAVIPTAYPVVVVVLQPGITTVDFCGSAVGPEAQAGSSGAHTQTAVGQSQSLPGGLGNQVGLVVLLHDLPGKLFPGHIIHLIRCQLPVAVYVVGRGPVGTGGMNGGDIIIIFI